MHFQPTIKRPLRKDDEKTYPLDDISVHETFMGIFNDTYLYLIGLRGYPIKYPINPYIGQVELNYAYSHLRFSTLTKWLKRKLNLYLNQNRKQAYLLSQIESVLSQVTYDLEVMRQFDKQTNMEIEESYRKIGTTTAYQFLEEYTQLWIKAVMAIKETVNCTHFINTQDDSFMLSDGTWSFKTLSWRVEKERNYVGFVLEWQTERDGVVYNGYRITVKYQPNKPYVLNYVPSFKQDPILDIKEKYYRRKDGDYQYYHVERNNGKLLLTLKGV